MAYTASHGSNLAEKYRIPTRGNSGIAGSGLDVEGELEDWATSQ